MVRLLWAASVYTRYFLRRYMPSNILLDAVRTRQGLKWGVPAMLLAAPHLLIANICARLLDAGAPGWLHLVVLWSIWCALKMVWIGPISVVLLIRARIREAATARQVQASPADDMDKPDDANDRWRERRVADRGAAPRRSGLFFG